MCYFSDTLCWLCTSVHGTEESNELIEEAKSLKGLLMPMTKAEMIRKARYAYSRQQKIVGGIPVEQGESPWTVRYLVNKGVD